MTAQVGAVPLDELKAKHRLMWASGDYPALAEDLLTELGPAGKREDVVAAVSLLFDSFGSARLIWGSDWPVLTLAGDYQGWFELAREAVAARDPSAVRAVMGDNAVRIYRPDKSRRK